MNTTKKLLIIALAAVLAAVSFVPSTFSWYTHNTSSEGKSLNYSKSDLPVSVKSGDITMTTVESDENGVKTGTTVSKIDNLAAGSMKYYVTTFTNQGKNDVMVNLQMKNLVNNADFVTGTISPTLNEKAYASRAARNRATYSKTRVYFKTHSNYSSFWSKDDGSLIPESVAAAGSNNSDNDINIAYKENGAEIETQVMMYPCSVADTDTSETNTDKVYYYDIPADAEYFYFFNHWYLKSDTNRVWNRTINITDASTKGRLFYLTGNSTSTDYKEYKVRAVNTDLAALNSYFDSVRMSNGSSVYADIGLKKTSEEEGFIPDYYGEKIIYSSSNTNVATVNVDGLITPVSTGNANITTKITGVFGDYIELNTAVSIPEKINQVPIMENILVPHKVSESPIEDDNGSEDENENPNNSVDVYWYAINKSPDALMNTDSIFFTI